MRKLFESTEYFQIYSRDSVQPEEPSGIDWKMVFQIYSRDSLDYL